MSSLLGENLKGKKRYSENDIILEIYLDGIYHYAYPEKSLEELTVILKNVMADSYDYLIVELKNGNNLYLSKRNMQRMQLKIM